MKNNLKKDRVKFVKLVKALIKEKGGELVKDIPICKVEWERFRIGPLTVTVYGESDHKNLYSVFIRTDCQDTNFRDNGKRNFHQLPCDPDFAFDLFKAHLESLLAAR